VRQPEHLDDTYDEKAVAWLEKLERKLGRLQLERFEAFGAILNALEYQIEEGEGDPSVVRHLGEAMLALATVHGWPAHVTKEVTQTLGQLHSHVSARAQARQR
jgi:hypothetical protein